MRVGEDSIPPSLPRAVVHACGGGSLSLPLPPRRAVFTSNFVHCVSKNYYTHAHVTSEHAHVTSEHAHVTSEHAHVTSEHAHVTTAHDRVTTFSRYDTFSNLNSREL